MRWPQALNCATRFEPLFFFQAEGGIRVFHVTGVQTCALPILGAVGDYLRGVAAEADARGYTFTKSKIVREGAVAPIPVTTGQLDHEWNHLRPKRAVRKTGKAASRERTKEDTRGIAMGGQLTRD